MKTKIYSLILALSAIPAFSQVGINTATPTATLDVNGTVKVRDIPASTALAGYDILALNQGSAQVSKVDPQLLLNSASNPTMFAAKKTTGFNLLGLSIFPENFKVINFLSTERNIGSGSLFSDTDYAYVIPSTGVYQVGFSFRYGSGLQAEVLGTSGPGIGILRTRGTVATLIDNRTFNGISIPLLLSLTISESNVSSLYSFQANDRVSFGITGSGFVSASVLGSSVGSFYIYKVSN
ncbi:MAG: hypothetical protein LBE92_03655 [Chryseobacterium sp.]|jgi:hypothetical protein|uniref:hypothetical protein n=1 Tax=Chryseobacterium sp. TaxID=1871047 RepID=UPI0028342CD8|nr:hypothetical protein [Chryseobacterium sp.]MDR2235197.1 hypothetical protein [Chryseobacterium sp.]